MGQNVLHHLTASPLVRGITVYDPVGEKMEQMKQVFPVKTAANLDEILQSPEIKLVFVTASNNVHKELTDCSARGW